MVVRNGYDWPLYGVRHLLSRADAALCNLECCVSLRGTPAEKGEHCSFYYRARPEMLQCLTRAGIDIVTAANNHGGDYGVEGVLDTAMWCRKAGLVCVGIGTRPAIAREPRLVQVGSVRMAIVGLDMTMPYSGVEKGRAGVNYIGRDQLRQFRRSMRAMGKWAEGRCDLLALTVHWGANWTRPTPELHRELARIAFDNGVDLILGHSAHRLQGTEVIDGKPVIYDMGNMLFDCALKDEGRQCGLFKLHLSVEGVHRIEFIPAQVLNGYTVPAGYEDATATLAEMRDLCDQLGTKIRITEDLEARPIGVIDIAEPAVTERPQPDPGLPIAVFPSDVGEVVLDDSSSCPVAEIPEDARKVTAGSEPAPNVHLLACSIPESVSEGGILYLTTWWEVSGPVDRNVLTAFRLSVAGESPRRGTPWYTRHDPGDWSTPLTSLEPGQIVRDFYPARLAGLPSGVCTVEAVVIDTTRAERDRILGEPCRLGEVEILPAERK